MPPPEKSRSKPALAKAETPAARPPASSNSLPPHRAEAIGALIARDRLLEAEQRELRAKVDAHNHRHAAIARERAEIRKKVAEHAWDGNPPADSIAF